jgi:hypothetical protein
MNEQAPLPHFSERGEVTLAICLGEQDISNQKLNHLDDVQNPHERKQDKNP